VRDRLLVIGPVPPPYHGVTASTVLLLNSGRLHGRFQISHLDTSDRRGLDTLGRWDLRNIGGALLALGRLLSALRGRPGTVYVPLSQSVGGVLRDSLFIRVAAWRGWAVATQLHGGEFDLLYRRQPRPLRWWIRDTLRRVTSMAVLGSSLRRVFDGLIAPERLVVVPNGTPEPSLRSNGRDQRVGLFLSNFMRRKGVLESIRAAAIVATQEPGATFLFVGDWEDPELEREARELVAATGAPVEFRPVTLGQEKDALLGRCGFLLFPPALPEGHPRVVLEALAAGVPVITTDRGAIAETVIDGESGFVLNGPDPEQLAAGMLRLIRDRALWERMSAAARARYLECYTQEIAEERLLSWLERVSAEVRS
jgi:glycosyltransferase involved in cell wall biosynthesis